MDAADNAHATGSLQWATTRLSELLAGCSRHTADPAAGEWHDPAAAVWLARTSRHLLQHAEHFAEIRPESLLLAGSSAHGALPEPPEDASEAALAALEPARPAAAAALVERLETEAAELREQCDPWADGALRRALDFLLADLASARAERPAATSEEGIHFRLVAPVG